MADKVKLTDATDEILEICDEVKIHGKKWYESNTIRINIIAVIAIALQVFMGYEVIDPNTQSLLLAAFNLILRIITKVPIV